VLSVEVGSKEGAEALLDELGFDRQQVTVRTLGALKKREAEGRRMAGVDAQLLRSLEVSADERER
jgi:S-adenosylmethionine:tRNA-ribosyltransferase-isomerase (queuine synthetase)